MDVISAILALTSVALPLVVDAIGNAQNRRRKDQATVEASREMQELVAALRAGDPIGITAVFAERDELQRAREAARLRDRSRGVGKAGAATR